MLVIVPPRVVVELKFSIIICLYYLKFEQVIVRELL
jgi:hypothetical protein